MTLKAEIKEKLKNLLVSMKEESEKACLKLNIQKMKIIASGPIAPWQIDGRKVETSFSWAPKSLLMVTVATKLKNPYSLDEKP